MAQPESDNIWVGDLPPQIQQPDLMQIFEQYGTVVSVRQLPPKQEGQNSCAMVRFETVEMAKWVVENLHGNIPQGLENPIITRFANAPGWKEAQAAKGYQDAGKGAPRWQPYPAKGGGADFGGKSKGKGKKGGPAPASFKELFFAIKKGEVLGSFGKIPEECTTYVKNLPPDTTDVDLYKLFAPFGAIAPTGVKAMMTPEGICKGIGFVDFVDPTAAATAVMALDNFALPDGTSLQVSQKTPSKGGGKGKGGGW